jgi:hypothetical protein
MGTLHYLVRARLEKQLRETGNAFIGVINDPGVVVPAHLRDQRTIGFHVGPALAFPAPVTFAEDHLTATLRFQGRGNLPIKVPYACLSVFGAAPGSGGPNGGRRQSA